MEPGPPTVSSRKRPCSHDTAAPTEAFPSWRRDHNTPPPQQQQQRTRSVPPIAGGSSLCRASPASSLSDSQASPAGIPSDVHPPTPRSRRRGSDDPGGPVPRASGVAWSKLDLFLGVDPSLRTLAQRHAGNQRHKAPSEESEDPEESTRQRHGQGPTERLAKDLVVADRVTQSDATQETTPKRSSDVAKSARRGGNPVNHDGDDDDDDDDFFNNLFQKPVAAGSLGSSGIRRSVPAARNAAPSPFPAPPSPLPQRWPPSQRPPRHESFPSAPKRRRLSDVEESPDWLAPKTPTMRDSSVTKPEQCPPSGHERPRYSWTSRTPETVPRNPLAKLEQDRRQLLAEQQYVSPRPTREMEDSLWEDSDEDTPATLGAKSERKRRTPAGRKDRTDQAEPSGTPNHSSLNRMDRGTLDRDSQKASERDAASLRKATSPATVNHHDSAEQMVPEFEEPKFFSPDAGALDIELSETNRYTVPRSINRYLLDYQREGIEFMCRAMIEYGGAILGDDMGLGKTVQVIALLAALLEKKGTGEDLDGLDRRMEIGKRNLRRVQEEKDFAIRNGRMPPQDYSQFDLEVVPTSKWAPILLLVPTNLVDHWKGDLNLWGHFGITVYRSGGPRLESLIESIQMNTSEILLCSTSMFSQEGTLAELQKIDWKLIVIDELHFAKSKKTRLSCNLRALKENLQDSRVIGLTGTPMQNEQVELWNIVDLVIQGHLGHEDEFERQYGLPIRMGRVKNAGPDAIAKAEEARNVLNETKLNMVLLQRSKEEKLKDELPSKDVRIVFCSMTQVQSAIYKHILDQPDFVCLKNIGAPCECGINQSWFQKFSKLKTDKEKLEYQRKNRFSLVPKGQCCYKAPWIKGPLEEVETIHPDAVLWRHQHGSGVLCDRCPSCILFPALSVLMKVCSHASLIQVDPNNYLKKSAAEVEYAKEKARVFIPKAVMNELPGEGIYRRVSVETKDLMLSGKMKVLDHLLDSIKDKNGRALLFSESTQLLDLIEQYIKMREGHNGYLRMDGKTAKELRTSTAMQFNQDTSKFVLLLSKKAFGTGLNLTAANYVILFDTDWNPATDSQAQDRAFRIGQTRDVVVYRLVTKGTIEELRYLRQVYKVQLKDETIAARDDSEQAARRRRYFRAVAGDKHRQGELFGIANLLKFKDGYFHDYGSASRDMRQKYDLDVHRADEIKPQLLPGQAAKLLGEDPEMDFESIKDIAKELVEERGPESVESDSDEEVLGGQSQVNMELLNKLGSFGDEEDEHGENDLQKMTLSKAPEEEKSTESDHDQPLQSRVNASRFPKPSRKGSVKDHPRPTTLLHRPSRTSNGGAPATSNSLDPSSTITSEAPASRHVTIPTQSSTLPTEPSVDLAATATSVSGPPRVNPVALLAPDRARLLGRKKKVRNFFFCGADPDRVQRS